MHDRAGGLYERMGLIQPAMDAYRRGHAYRQAPIPTSSYLCKRISAHQFVSLWCLFGVVLFESESLLQISVSGHRAGQALSAWPGGAWLIPLAFRVSRLLARLCRHFARRPS